ncbi:hypothetical protein PSEUDO8O_150156 [Pseudomonas sp. 8O]|nr:hypothetical protein PSEUDO8O_150156 [Pseudomonas sp. 8O]
MVTWFRSAGLSSMSARWIHSKPSEPFAQCFTFTPKHRGADKNDEIPEARGVGPGR